MKLLICAQAQAEIVLKCLREFQQGNDITVVVPSDVGRVLKESEDIGSAELIRLKGKRFCDDSIAELEPLKNEQFDAAVMVSEGPAFVGFDKVIETIDGLRFNGTLIFYNSIGHREVIYVPNGVGRILERCAVRLLYGFCSMIRPIELFVERIYIQCAELLGL